MTWKAPAAGGEVATYEVYRLAADETDYSKVGETTSTAYTDADLTHEASYSYKVTAVDNAGSVSVASNVVTGTAEGKYFSPPSAGGTPSASAGSTTATITWSTTRPTYGTVEYGKTDNYGSSAGDGTLAETHSVKVTGLAAS